MRHAAAIAVMLTASMAGAAERIELDANRAVELALASSDRADAAAARIDAAADRVDAADALRVPVVDLQASASHRSSVPEAAFPASIPDIGGFVLFPNIQDTYRAGVTLRQPLWTGGEISASRQAARQDEQAAEADASRVATDLRYEARTAYWRAVAARSALDAAMAEAERAQQLLDDAKALRSAGMAVRADELGAEARLAAARLKVIDAEAELDNRIAELRSLLGLSDRAELVLSEQGSHLPAAPPELDVVVSEARSQRAEIAALAARRDALASRSTTVAADGRPQISLAAQWDVARPNERYLPLQDQWDTSWSVGVVAGWRVFDGGRTAGQAAALDAQRRALEAELGELERRVELEVETARRTLEASLAADAAASASVAAATAREADSRDRYTAGIATMTEVLDAQSELADAELARVRARAGAWIAEAALRRAVGR